MRELLRDKMFLTFAGLILIGIAVNLSTSDPGIEVIGALTAIGGVMGLVLLKLVMYS